MCVNHTRRVLPHSPTRGSDPSQGFYAKGMPAYNLCTSARVSTWREVSGDCGVWSVQRVMPHELELGFLQISGLQHRGAVLVPVAMPCACSALFTLSPGGCCSSQPCLDFFLPPASGSRAVTKIKRRKHTQLITSSKEQRHFVSCRLFVLSRT